MKTLTSIVNETIQRNEPSIEDFSVFIIEIDNISDVNIAYGEKEKQRVLNQIKLQIINCLRKEDSLDTWEDFGFLILAKIPIGEAEYLVSRLCKEVGIPINIGVAPLSEHEEIDLAIEQADVDLYHQKQKI